MIGGLIIRVLGPQGMRAAVDRRLVAPSGVPATAVALSIAGLLATAFAGGFALGPGAGERPAQSAGAVPESRLLGELTVAPAPATTPSLSRTAALPALSRPPRRSRPTSAAAPVPTPEPAPEAAPPAAPVVEEEAAPPAPAPVAAAPAPPPPPAAPAPAPVPAAPARPAPQPPAAETFDSTG